MGHGRYPERRWVLSKSYYTEEEFRAEFGISKTKSWRLRKSGTGPRYFKLGGTIYYPAVEIERWVGERMKANNPATGLRVAK
jgi:predicted DNA-binding transcriptional regulator AlpA